MLKTIATATALLVGLAAWAAPPIDQPGKPGGNQAKGQKYSVEQIVAPWEQGCDPNYWRAVSARRLNERAEMVGFTDCYVATGDPNVPFTRRSTYGGFAWSPVLGPQRLDGFTTSRSQMFPRDINESGIAVGFELGRLPGWPYSSIHVPLKWTLYGGVVEAFVANPCGSLPGRGMARGINDQGDILADEMRWDHATEQCRWFWVLKFADGTEAVGPEGTPYAVNNNQIGVGAGESIWHPDGSSEHVYIKWSPSKGQSILGSIVFDEFGSRGKTVLYLNNLDDAVGRYEDTYGGECGSVYSPILFKANGTEQLLPTPQGLPNGWAYGINDLGDVVGGVFTTGCAADRTERAALWKNGMPVDLNEQIPRNSGIELHTAFSINNSGQIVAYGALTDEPEMPCPVTRRDPATGQQTYEMAFCKNRHSFLLTPITKGNK